MTNIAYNQALIGDKLTVTLGDTIIKGEVVEVKRSGSRVVKIDGNLNKITLTSGTNFSIDKEEPKAADILAELEVGEQFEYLNKFGKIKLWVKTGGDRYTRVDNERPATSYSAAGFPGTADKVTLV